MHETPRHQALRFLRIEELVVLRLMQGVGVQSSPEAFIDLLNLPGKTFSGVKGLFGAGAGSAAKSSPTSCLGLAKLSLGSPRTQL